MDQKNVKQIVKYWQKTAEHDHEIMISLLKSKKYSGCLFFGHIVLEKILKALVVQETKNQAPYTHDLVLLQKIAKLKLENELIKFLKEVNNFNIRSRYPDYKLRFYQICTEKFTQEYFKKIIDLYQVLCKKLK